MGRGRVKVCEKHEAAFFRTFAVKRKRKRFLEQLASKRGRIRLRESLPHFTDFDERWMFEIPPASQTTDGILFILRAKGATANCCVISYWDELDGRQLSLTDALREVVGVSGGTIISCIPGRVAYFEGENPGDRCVFIR